MLYVLASAPLNRANAIVTIAKYLNIFVIVQFSLWLCLSQILFYLYYFEFKIRLTKIKAPHIGSNGVFFKKLTKLKRVNLQYEQNAYLIEYPSSVNCYRVSI